MNAHIIKLGVQPHIYFMEHNHRGRFPSAANPDRRDASARCNGSLFSAANSGREFLAFWTVALIVQRLGGGARPAV